MPRALALLLTLSLLAACTRAAPDDAPAAPDLARVSGDAPPPRDGLRILVTPEVIELDTRPLGAPSGDDGRPLYSGPVVALDQGRVPAGETRPSQPMLIPKLTAALQRAQQLERVTRGPGSDPRGRWRLELAHDVPVDLVVRVVATVGLFDLERLAFVVGGEMGLGTLPLGVVPVCSGYADAPPVPCTHDAIEATPEAVHLVRTRAYTRAGRPTPCLMAWKLGAAPEPLSREALPLSPQGAVDPAHLSQRLNQPADPSSCGVVRLEADPDLPWQRLASLTAAVHAAAPDRILYLGVLESTDAPAAP